MKKMTSFQTKKLAFLTTKECYKEVLKLVMAVVTKLPEIKTLIVNDKTIFTLLTMLLSYNSFIPSGYLTKYELSKAQFSLAFGFLYKNE